MPDAEFLIGCDPEAKPHLNRQIVDPSTTEAEYAVTDKMAHDLKNRQGKRNPPPGVGSFECSRFRWRDGTSRKVVLTILLAG